MTMEPMVTPRKPIMSGSMSVSRLAMAESTSCFVEVGDLAEHAVERAGLLADADHLRDHVREDFGRLQRFDEALAALDARTNLADRFFDDDVAGGARRDVERL